jgi:hypothetical protein
MQLHLGYREIAESLGEKRTTPAFIWWPRRLARAEPHICALLVYIFTETQEIFFASSTSSSSLFHLCSRTYPSPIMAALLDIPRELFLMICASLTPQDLANLTAVSRNTYVATLPVLYHSVTLSNHAALVKFTRTLVKSPVVSQLTQR